MYLLGFSSALAEVSCSTYPLTPPLISRKSACYPTLFAFLAANLSSKASG